MSFLTFIKKIYYKAYKRLAISPYLRCIAIRFMGFFHDSSIPHTVLSIISLFLLEKMILKICTA